MAKLLQYALLCVVIVVSFFLPSCEDFLNPDQELAVTEDQMYDDWYEYRSVAIGLYAIQRYLVEQIIVLGDLRGDYLTVTPDADADLLEISNFYFPKDNKYVSPAGFYKLISACNNFIRILQERHPEVTDPQSPVTNYDKIYGEALCMRAWAYFNAALIYGKVPYIPESLVTPEEVYDFINSTGTYIDSVFIEYGIDGYHNADTVLNKPVTLEKQLMGLDVVLDMFIGQLENNVKAVGVNHHMENDDITWEVTIWNSWAWHTLLGKLYMYQGDLARAVFHFEKIIYNSTGDLRYQLDGTFSFDNWKGIFSSIDYREHILTMWFNKSYYQKNALQDLFETRAPHDYMLKPTTSGISGWENSNDFSRGPGDSYSYVYEGNYYKQLGESEIQEIRSLRWRRDYKAVEKMVSGYDTVVYKYSIDKNTFDEDAFFILYRAAEVHLDLAEIYTYWAFNDDGTVRTFTLNALNILNDGSNYNINESRPQMGVRGRVGLRGINLNWLENGNLEAKQNYLDEQILSERGRELAYEGKRFYDLMRVAKRLNDPGILANKVAAKYPWSKRFQIRSYLMDENNWYIHYFE